ncbi:heparanase [Crotalus tigris]|uniref:heparanase n=1 Tax=Crotalus tigris TaxID=88082 RepID=UPI00192F7F5D|nr:heparanase [Crotalus tigris]
MPPPPLLFLLLPLLHLCGWRVRDAAGSWPAEKGRKEDEAALSFQLSREPLRKVSPFFLSVTLDSNLITDPKYITFLGSTKLRTLTRGLSPAFLRFGGTKGDFLIFDPQQKPTPEEKIFQDFLRKQATVDFCAFRSAPLDFIAQLQSQWLFEQKLIFREQVKNKYKNITFTESTLDILYNFANCSNLHLIFGLNALLRTGSSQWNSSNAQQILNYTNSQNYILSWELGNEPNSFLHKSGIEVNGHQLGQDFIQLRQLLNNYIHYKNAKIYGPDLGRSSRKHSKILLKSFLKSGGKVLDSVTWHHYYINGRIATRQDFLNPDILDSFKTNAEEVLEIVNSAVPDKSVWLGETSSAFGGGTPNLSNAYIAGFMWLDKLGLSAQLGVDLVMRQVLYGAGNYQLVDANFEPLPDYWLSLLYKKLVGPTVLHVAITGLDPKKLRVYLHCTNTQHPKYREGDITLFALNLYNSPKRLYVPSYFSKKQIDEYLLLPYREDDLLSRSVQLNGFLLKMPNDETLPILQENPLIPGHSLDLPAFSYGFYVIRNAKVLACI